MLKMRVGVVGIVGRAIHLWSMLSTSIRISIRKPGLEPRIGSSHVWAVGHWFLGEGEFLGRKNVLLFDKLKFWSLRLGSNNLNGLFAVHGVVPRVAVRDRRSWIDQ